MLAHLLGGLPAVPIEGWAAELMQKQALALPAGWDWTKPAAAAAVSDGEVKKAYLLAVRALHPDKTAALPLRLRLGGEQVFTLLNSAWQAWQDGKNGTLLGGAGGGAED